MQTDDFHVFDTTLRDGAQREGITYSVADKLAVARLLDQLGVGFIEGGWPGAMPKDTEFFARAADGELDAEARRAGRVRRHPQGRRPGRRTTRRCGRCSTRGRRSSPSSPSPTCWHVERALRTTLEENLAMVARHRRVPARRGPPGVRRLRALLRRLPARPRLRRAGARRRGRGRRRRRRPVRHQRRHAADGRPRRRHRRAGVAPASGSASTPRTTPAARWPTPSPPSTPARRTCRAPPTATASGPATPTSSPSSAGWSPRWAATCCPTAAWPRCCGSSHAIAEIANLAPDTHAPYVGASAFAHKAGLHASAIKVDPELYNHLDPDGGRQRPAHPGHRDGRAARRSS